MPPKSQIKVQDTEIELGVEDIVFLELVNK